MGLYEGIKDVASIAQKADNIQLYKQLLDLGAQALDMQDEIRKLKEENAELKKEKNLESKIIRHNQPYITLSDDENNLKYCATCWDNNRKIIQMKTLDNMKYYCHACKNNFYNK